MTSGAYSTDRYGMRDHLKKISYFYEHLGIFKIKLYRQWLLTVPFIESVNSYGYGLKDSMDLSNTATELWWNIRHRLHRELPSYLSLVAPEVVTNSGAARDENLIKMTSGTSSCEILFKITFSFQCAHVSQTMLWLCDYTPAWLQQCNKLVLHKCPGQHLTTREIFRADSRLPPSQWETSLQSNTVSHWLGANPESAPILMTFPVSYWAHAMPEIIQSEHIDPYVTTGRYTCHDWGYAT